MFSECGAELIVKASQLRVRHYMEEQSFGIKKDIADPFGLFVLSFFFSTNSIYILELPTEELQKKITRKKFKTMT